MATMPEREAAEPVGALFPPREGPVDSTRETALHHVQVVGFQTMDTATGGIAVLLTGLRREMPVLVLGAGWQISTILVKTASCLLYSAQLLLGLV